MILRWAPPTEQDISTHKDEEKDRGWCPLRWDGLLFRHALACSTRPRHGALGSVPGISLSNENSWA